MISLWSEGRIDGLLYLRQAIQDRSKVPENAINISKISKKFKVLITKGNVNGTLKLLRNGMPNGILPLYDKTLNLLKQKHLEPKESSPETLLQGPFRPIHPVAYDDIDESLVMRALMLTKGGSGPSGLDADG